eukprot:CAMPEP_0113547684 /NCGR_PEP_ID=MMETSP0015_2-20120614/12489_1 /TAXON_ID=2838 /ORGANISM="Odontella" /LENGTH=159 /DNA_ID=CAMNT_0000448259 /DNA_START=77 /DNA_END=553 /DNA_ORIENTATION=+ /assembly_acc=CAM_ASM_000160
MSRDTSACRNCDIAEMPLHLTDASQENHLICSGVILTGLQLTQAFDSYAGSSIVSDDDESMNDDNLVTPLDFRVDWSKETVDNLKECFESDKYFSLVSKTLKDSQESTGALCVDFETESVCSCDDMSDIDDCEQLRDIWDESTEAAREQSLSVDDSKRS